MSRRDTGEVLASLRPEAGRISRCRTHIISALYRRACVAIVAFVSWIGLVPHINELNEHFLSQPLHEPANSHWRTYEEKTYTSRFLSDGMIGMIRIISNNINKKSRWNLFWRSASQRPEKHITIGKFTPMALAVSVSSFLKIFCWKPLKSATEWQ